tara:strand:- start:2956 stop:6156 length:3201 start_codon:yes stop_codon:yes gene_type:complete
MVQNIISSLGAGSGIDTKALVEGLVASERAPREAVLDKNTQTYEAQISGYGALRSALAGIQDSVKLLSDPDIFNGRNVAFPDSTLVTPTNVESNALAGDYRIEVLALANAHALSVGGFSAPDAVVGNGTLSLTLGDWAADYSSFTANAAKTVKNISIDASNNTLTGVRDAINAAGIGVQASIIENGGSYTLQLSSASGANNELQIVVTEGSPTGLGALAYTGFPPVGGMSENQSGADASLKINGLTVNRETNQIDDVVGGLEFTLNNISVANETVTISVTEDKAVGEQTLRDFVDIYNEFLTSVTNLTKSVEADADDEDVTPGSLARDPSAKSMINQVRSQISQSITGLDGNFTALATVGVQTQLDGTLKIKEDLFQQAIDDNYSELTQLFTGKTSSSDAQIEVIKTSASTAAGSYEVVVTTPPAKGAVAGNAVSAGDATTLGLTLATGVFSGGLDTSLGDYTFQVSVDGTQSAQISLSGTYADTDALIADMQSQINGDPALAAVNAALDLSYDPLSGSFAASSRAYGDSSSVSFSALSVDMGRLGLGASSGELAAGAVVDSGVTALGSSGTLNTTGTLDDTALSATDLGSQGSLTTTTPINAINTGLQADAVGTFTPALTLTAADSFVISVDGLSSGAIDLTGSYATADDLASAMQSLINSDPALLGTASVTVAFDDLSDTFSFTSNSGGAGSTVEIDSTSLSANMTDLGIVSTDVGIAGVDNETFVNPLVTSGGGYSFDIAVDGAASVSVALSGTYNTAEELRADLQAQIIVAGGAVTVGYDATTNRFSISSDSAGAASTVEITALGADIDKLGFSLESGTPGDANAFVSPLDTSGGGYSFDVTVDGGAATSVLLTGSYAGTEEVRAAIESQLSGVTVSYDSAATGFVFTSNTTGVTSTVEISNPGANIANLGISAATGVVGKAAATASAGADVVGTINGVAAFGSGNILLPKLGSDLAGLSLRIAPGATSSTITLSRGFANELSNILDGFLKNKGLIADRETRLNTRLDDVKDDRTDLDRRMEARFSVLQGQFLAMERIIASLNSVSGSLDGLVDRLPFTASK